MIRSMTGFGSASEQVDGIQFNLEVRSLNNRYFKANIRLPEEIAALEAEIETVLRRCISRGSVTLVIKMNTPGAMAAHQVNDQALMVYLDHLETLHGKFTDTKRSINIDLTALLALPGVLQPSTNAQDLVQKVRPVLLRLTQQGCEELGQMRQNEGQSLAKELSGYCELIAQRVEQIKLRAPEVVEEYHVRLKSRIEELMARAQVKSQEKDLIHEVAIFAERADISEELSRMGGHLKHFEQVVRSEDREAAGRTLEFLGQEMLREANTIASKSNDAPISRCVVEIKGTIDRIREQVQNVE